MNKKINRYRIAQISGIETRPLKNEAYLKELLNNIEKYNNNQKNPFLLGNIEINRREKIITFKKYKIIRNASTLESIDECTTGLKNEHELKLLFGTNLRNHHPIVIVYRANKQIKTLPIIYKKHKEYLDRNYIKSLLIKHGKCYEFITNILENKQIESNARDSLDDFDTLYSLRESIKTNFPLNINLSPLLRFYTSFITDSKNKKFNYFNFRLLSILLIDYESETKEEKIEREEIIGQTKIKEYVITELRELMEELKMALFEETLEEEYQKILKPNSTKIK